MTSSESDRIQKTCVPATVPNFLCDLEQVVERSQDLCFFICEMGTISLPNSALLGREEKEVFPPHPGTVVSQEKVEAVPLLVAAAAQSSGPHSSSLSPPGERDAGAGHCLDVCPPLYGVLGVPAGTEVPCDCLAPKLLLFTLRTLC